MLQNSIHGLLSLVARYPQLLTLAASNASGRLKPRMLGNGKTGQAAPPEQITVMVTDLCNLRCKMCQYAHDAEENYQLNRQGRMAPSLFQKLIDETPQNRLVSLTGGEPLLHPDLPDFISYVKKKGRICSVTTNGWHLPERAREICQAGLDILIVSVDGLRPVHDQVRGRGSFERLEKGLKAVLSISPRPMVFTTMAISNINCAQIEHVYRQSLLWGVDGTNFNHLWIHLRNPAEKYQFENTSLGLDEVRWSIQPERVDVDYLVYQLETVKALNRRRKFILIDTPALNEQQIRDWYQDPGKFVKWSTTRCAWIRMKIWPDGSFKPCRGWSVGSIADHDAMDLWNQLPIRKFRQHLARQGTFPICARCCYLAHR